MSSDTALLTLLGIPDDPAAAQEVKTESTFGWATVTASSPLRIRKDGETDELPMTPDMLGNGPYGVGSRVWIQHFGKRIIVLGVSGAQATFMRNAQASLSGGGLRACEFDTMKWSDRLIVMGAGRGERTAQAGYYNIFMPPNGTLIPVLGRSTPGGVVTVSGGVIQMGVWDALYYEIPFGSVDGASVDGNFRLVSYESDVAVPSTWLRIIARNNDPMACAYTWGDGRQQDYWHALTTTNNWVTYGSGYAAPAARYENGAVTLKGMVKSGIATAGAVIGTLDARCIPVYGTRIFPVVSAGVFGSVDVNAAGQVVVRGVSNTYVDLGVVHYLN